MAKLQHKWTFLSVVGKDVRNNKPVHHAICSCGKQYKGTMRQFRHFKCENTEKLADKELYDKYKYSAKVREIEFKLTLEQFNMFTRMSCTYCDADPSMEVRGEKFNGLDREDSSKGYVLNNVTACCATCNKMKGTLTSEEFVEKIRQIHSYFIPDYEMMKKYEKTFAK